MTSAGPDIYLSSSILIIVNILSMLEHGVGIFFGGEVQVFISDLCSYRKLCDFQLGPLHST